jgi:hypothetical protein
MLAAGLTHQIEAANPGWMDRVWRALGQPSYHNWLFDRPVHFAYYPTLFRVMFDDETQPTKPYGRAKARAKDNPDELWLLGNEPHIANQGLIAVTTFAAVVRDWLDHTNVTWAAPGIILQPDGYDWLEGYLAAGGPIPDYWHVHLYWQLLPKDWQKRLDEFKQWAAKRQIERPVIVTETNANSRDPIDQMRLMDYLATIPETVYWYSSLDYFSAWPHTDLVNWDGSLTELGRHFAGLMGVGGQAETHTIYLPDVPA